MHSFLTCAFLHSYSRGFTMHDRVFVFVTYCSEVDKHGKTALDYALACGHSDMAMEVLPACDSNLVDIGGMTPLMVACIKVR
jgi:ankyrin repeat protein